MPRQKQQTTKQTKRQLTRDDVLARAEEARRQAEALTALSRLDLSVERDQITSLDKQIASARRTIQRAETELASATRERQRVIDTIRERVATTGAQPAVASALLAIPESWCQVRSVVSSDTDTTTPQSESESESEPEPEPEPEPVSVSTEPESEQPSEPSPLDWLAPEDEGV